MSSTSLLARKKLVLLVGRTLGIMTLLFVASAWAQSTEKVIFDLGTPGAGGSLIVDRQGNLFGTASGDPGQPGTIYEVKLSANGTWRHYVLYRFLGGNDGKHPNAGLIFDNTGNLYGTTQVGGANACPYSSTSTCGTVFELSPTPSGGWTETQLYNFVGGGGNNTDGENPNGGLVADAAGNLYGTTASGGNYYHGTIFRLTPESNGTWTESVLYRFSGGVDGAGPSGLVRDSKGSLYGFTRGGGVTQGGTIFELSPNPDGTWTYQLLYTFCSRTNCSDGDEPTGIALDSQRNLYGFTNYGGSVPCFDADSGCGTLFKLVRGTSGSWVFHLLHTFCKLSACLDGAFPYGSPTQAPDGTLYGLAIVGGTNNQGTLFKVVHSPSGWVLATLYSFCSSFPCPDGQDPTGTLALDSAGHLYGTTPVGGKGDGVVFQVTP